MVATATKLKSYAQGDWIAGQSDGNPAYNAVNGELVTTVSSDGLDFKGMLEYARTIGNPNLRKMTFHRRAVMLKEIAIYLLSRKEEIYEVSAYTGATKIDSWIDIEGGIQTFFSYSGRGRRDFPDEPFYVEGPAEPLSKEGTFIGRHICVPLTGTALHINAFNFPCWGMLEKLAPTFLAGMPAIVKPASVSSYVTQKMVEVMLESGLLPQGALQIICGSVGDTFDHLTAQDVVTFTGSAHTGRKLKSHPVIIENSVRFNLEADSLNCSILASDATPDTDEFGLFIKEVANEMSIKAGQRCTAIRRTIVPHNLVNEVIDALKARFAKIKVGDPSIEGVRMGPLIGRDQVGEVNEKLDELKRAAELVFGGDGNFDIVGGDKEKGAFFPHTLLHCPDPFNHAEPHDVEAFGPVNTVMPYKSIEEAIDLVKLGRGMLCGSVFTSDDQIAREITLGIAPYNGRILIINKDCARESTGHGSPLPNLVHGGPGRAGGGEEMGGSRGVLHYMQRTALQGSPSTLTAITNEWSKGAKQKTDRVHIFRKYFEEIEIGETLNTHRRTVTETDIVNFAGVSGDYFYAHMDDIAAKESMFENRVAHGYFILSAAAGLFVDPAPGPVLANYGLENLRFTEPVHIGDTIRATVSCKRKIWKARKEEDKFPSGIIEWAIEVFNQDDIVVATYTILTLWQRKED